MRSAEEWHKERLSSSDCFNPEWIRNIQREAFDAGVEAMAEASVAQFSEQLQELSPLIKEARP